MNNIHSVAMPDFEAGTFLAAIKDRFKVECIRCKRIDKLYTLYQELSQQTGCNDLQTVVNALWVLPRFIDFDKYD